MTGARPRLLQWCLVLFALAHGGFASAQTQPRYSQSAEYQRMLEEIRKPAPSPAFIATGSRPAADPALAVEVDENEATLHLKTSAATYAFDKAKATLTVQNLKTGASWTIAAAANPAGCGSASSRGAAISRHANAWTLTGPDACGGAGVTLTLLTAGLAELTISRPASAAASQAGATSPGALSLQVTGSGPFFGLGERFWQASLAGTALDVRPQDRSGEPGHGWTYVAIPFVYGPGGLGLYADTAFDTNFRVDEKDASMELKIASSPATIYLFAEPSPEAVLTAYTAITGRPQNPPLWTFGPWITALGGKGAVFDAAERIRAEGVPASALWVYDQNEVPTNLGWPFWFSNYYGPARPFVDALHDQGFKVLSYVHPYVRAVLWPYPGENPLFAKGVDEKLLMTDAGGAPAGPRFEGVPVGNVDFTNPKAVDWWESMITAAVRDEGFDGWMEDFGEWVRDTDRFAAGTGTTLSELYPLLYHKITLRIAQGINPEVAPFSRSGSPGSQQWSPVLWGADQQANWSRDYGLPSVVTAGITAGMSGFSTWGPDILSTGESRDLWMRWVEFGALTPVMRDHPWDKPPRSINLFTDAEATAHFRRWAAFHSSLLPYLATYAEQAHRTGVPIMRHPGLEFPGDPRSIAAEYEYLLGRELLVAPVIEPAATTRKLYLPPGEWVNFWSGDFLNGGQDVSIDASGIPILVRAGSILPFKPEAEAAQWNWEDPQLLATSLVWKAYPSKTGDAEGSFALPNGTSAHLVQHAGEVTIEGRSRTGRDYEVVLRTRQQPTAVKLGGKAIPASAAAATARPATRWWWNSSTTELHLIFHAEDFRVEVSGVVPTQVGYEQLQGSHRGFQAEQQPA